MKGYIQLMLLTLVLATAAVAAPTTLPASGQPETGTEYHPPVLRFICITPCVNEPFFRQVAAGAADAARRMGAECEFTGTTAVDIPLQVKMVRDAIARGYDGIALNVVHPTAFDPVIEEARQRGIPLVAFNVNAQPRSRVPTVAQNLYDGGREAAFFAAPLIPAGSQVLITGHDGDFSATDPRQQGIRDGLADRQLRWQTVVTSGNVAEVEQRMTAALRANPGVRAIFATGLSNTEGTGHAIEKHFRDRDCVVVGFDVSPEVTRLMKEGVVHLTIDQQAYAQGFYPIVQLAMAKLHGIRPSNFDTGVRVIRAKDLVASAKSDPR